MTSSALPPPERLAGEYFLAPATAAQRRYEALRAYFVEGLTRAEAGVRFGYTPATMASLIRDFRGGYLDFFGPRSPTRRRSPAKERARARIVELRQAGHSIVEIS